MKNSTKLFWLLLALCLPTIMFAEGQVKSKQISSDYSRSSISRIIITYNDQWDGDVISGINSVQPSSKFDVNTITTKTTGLKGIYRTAEQYLQAHPAAESSSGFFSFSSSGPNYSKPDTLTQRLITEYLNNNNVGKQIFDYVLAVDNQGRFQPDILVERSRWNATDKDVQLDNASQVKTIETNGEALLANSYIVVFDVKEPKRGETTDYEGNKVPQWTAYLTAYVFSIENAEDVVASILHTMWIYDNDDASTVANKRELYRNVRIPMTCVASVTVNASSKESMAKAIASSLASALASAEKKISAWEVATGLETVRPYITAKIGTKEGIKNGQRFRLYRNEGDPDQPETMVTKKKGFARATVINDNNEEATGETGVSYFYQISGMHLKGTEFMKQSNDIRLGVSLDYNYNGLGMGPNNKIFGAYSMVDLTFDYLAYIHKCGIGHYARVNVGYDLNLSKDLEKGAETNNVPWYTYADGDNAGKAIFGQGVSYVNVSIGYSCGIRLRQVMEFQPFVNVGLDVIVPHGFDNTVLSNMSEAVLGKGNRIDFTDKTAKQTFGLFVDPGLRIAFNCGYPFQIYIQADYAFGFMQWDAYKVLNGYAKQCGYGHEKGLGAALGFKWTF